MKSALTLLLLAAFAMPAQARIGETLQECLERYGPIRNIDEKAGLTYFHKSGFTVAIHFHEDHADSVDYIRTGEDQKGTPYPLTPAEIQVFLSVNGKELEWLEAPRSTRLVQIWETNDGKILAQYDSRQHILTVITKAATEHTDAAAEAEAKQSLQGF